MHRQGCDPQNIQPEDILCDFCEQPWSDDRPMVEGHRGSCICGPCLTVAYATCINAKNDDPRAPTETCTLCLEPSDERRHWRSPMREQALVCSRCLKQAGGALHKDADIAWRKPTS